MEFGRTKISKWLLALMFFPGICVAQDNVLRGGSIAARLDLLDEEQSTLSKKLAILDSQIAVLQTAIPAGAILAFNLATCPEGWKSLPEASGRALIGAGQVGNLTNRTLGDQGGSERHKLTVAEIPSHSHQIETRHNTSNTPDDRVQHADPASKTYGPARTQATGGGAAHNNMPPFLVVTYCQRDG